jgi:hypothetical protein
LNIIPANLVRGLFFAALDNVIVAMWYEAGQYWCDRCIYRPIRSFYHKIEWNGSPYHKSMLVEPEEWEIVNSTGLEVSDEQREKIQQGHKR